MRWSGFGGGRDPEAPPGTWLPHGEVWVAIGTAVAGTAVVASILASGGHSRTGANVRSAAPSGARAPSVAGPTSAAPATTAAPPTTAAPRPTVTPRTVAPTTAPAPPTTGRPAWTPDPLLTGAMPSLQQLGPGWAVVSGLSSAGGAPSTAGPCPADPLPYAEEGAALGVAYDDGAHQASAALTLFRVVTPAAAAKEATFTGSLGVVPCLGVSAARDTAPYPWLGELEGTEFTDSRAPVALHQHGDAELLSVTVQVDGAPKTAQWAFVHQYAGRYEALTVVSWCTCKPLPAAALQRVVDASGTAVAILAAKSP